MALSIIARPIPPSNPVENLKMLLLFLDPNSWVVPSIKVGNIIKLAKVNIKNV